MQVEVDDTYQHVLSARVQQAFLPKFENEGQDSSISDSIVQQADQRWGPWYGQLTGISNADECIWTCSRCCTSTTAQF